VTSRATPVETPAWSPALPSLAQLTAWSPLAVVIALAAVLRLYGISTHSLWLDEIDEGTTAGVAFPEIFDRVRHDAAAAPLDYLAVKLTTAVLGHGTFATRAWAVFLGIAAVPLMYEVGRRIFESRAVGLAAALLLGVSAFHVYYSQEARFYALAVVVALLNVLAFERALGAPGVVPWLLYGASCALALYSYYFAAFLFPLEGLYVVGLAVWTVVGSARRGRWLSALRIVGYCAAAQVLAALAFVPWVTFAFLEQLRASWPANPDLTPDRVVHVYDDLVGLAWQWGPATPGETAMTDAILALALIGLIASLLRRRFLPLLLAGGAIVAIPLAWRADQLTHYIFIDRQAIVVLPLLLLLAAAGYVEAFRLVVLAISRADALGWLRSARLSVDGLQLRSAAAGFWVGLAVVWTAVSAPALGHVYDNSWRVKEDWRGATIFVSANLCGSSTLYTQLGPQYSYGIDYYNAQLAPRTHYAGETPTTVESMVFKLGLTPNDWIVLHPETEGGGDQSALGRYLIGRGWQRTSFGGGVTVYHGPTCPIGASH